MTSFFTLLASLPPLLQIPVILIAFAIVVGLVLFFVEIAPRPGTGYTIVRLAVAVLVPAGAVLLLGVYNSAVWLVAIAAVVGAIMFVLDLRARTGKGYLLQLLAFMLPTIVLLAIGLLYPAIQTVVQSFFSNDGSKFVGLGNFAWIFSGGGPGFVALINTIVWLVLAPPIATAIGLAYAVLIDKSRGEKIFKVLVFMPFAISFVGASIIFKFFFDYQQGAQIGLLNQIVVWFGGQPVSWLQTSPLNTVFLIIILIWSQTGFAMVMQSAAIRGVPPEQQEAASLDGANAWQRFRNVTVPGIRPTIIVVWITISIVSLKIYDIIAATTAGFNNTTVLGYEMVREFDQLPAQTGYSSALAVLIFVLMIPFVIFNVRNMRKQRADA